MVFLAAVTGLRASELLALNWGHQFDSLEISANRGVVQHFIGDVKTEASRKPLRWTRTWLSTSRMATNVAIQGGKIGCLRALRCAASSLTAREPSAPAHSPRGQAMRDRQADWLAYFSAQLCNSLEGEWRRREVVQESLRHANSRITLDTYTQALTTAKREAQTKVVKMILPERTHTAVAEGGK